MNKIDLSKIKVKEIPTKTIKANFEGVEKDYTIFELQQAQLVQLNTFRESINDYMRVRTSVVFTLSAGLQIEFSTAEFLFDNCTLEAVRVANLIYDFAADVQEEKVKEAEEAEKNSQTETQNP